MNRPLVLMCWVGLCTLGGCAGLSSHQTARDAALDRWGTSRARVKAQLAQEEFAAGRLASAASELDEARQLDPQNLDYAVLEVQVLLGQGETGQASQCLQRLAEQSPERADIAYLRGILAQQRLDWTTAAEHFSRALALAPDDVDYFAAVVQTLLQLGERGAAQDMLQAFADEFGWHDSYQAALAESLEQQGQWADAAEVWCRLIDGDADVAVLRRRALALHHAGRWAEAVATLEQCLAQPDVQQTQQLRLLLAECRWNLGDAGGAQRTAEQILATEPEQVDALRLLAQAVASRGEFARAARLAERAYQQAPQRRDLAAIAATLAYRAGQPELARQRALVLSQSDHAADLALADRILQLTTP